MNDTPPRADDDVERLAAKQWIESRPNGYSLSAGDLAAYARTVRDAALREARAECERLRQNRDDYKFDYIRTHKDKCDLLDFLIERGLWVEYRARPQPSAPSPETGDACTSASSLGGQVSNPGSACQDECLPSAPEPIYTGAKPTIHELEEILEREGNDAIAINPDGSITTVPSDAATLSPVNPHHNLHEAIYGSSDAAADGGQPEASESEGGGFCPRCNRWLNPVAPCGYPDCPAADYPDTSSAQPSVEDVELARKALKAARVKWNGDFVGKYTLDEWDAVEVAAVFTEIRTAVERRVERSVLARAVNAVVEDARQYPASRTRDRIKRSLLALLPPAQGGKP